MTSATVKASRADKPARAGQAEGEPVADPLSAIRETGGRLAFDCGPGSCRAAGAAYSQTVFWSLVTDRYATRECLPARAIMSDQTRHQAWSLQLRSRGQCPQALASLGLFGPGAACPSFWGDGYEGHVAGQLRGAGWRFGRSRPLWEAGDGGL